MFPWYSFPAYIYQSIAVSFPVSEYLSPDVDVHIPKVYAYPREAG